MKTLALAVVLTLLPGISLADKVTTDPNGPNASPNAKEQLDERHYTGRPASPQIEAANAARA